MHFRGFGIQSILKTSGLAQNSELRVGWGGGDLAAGDLHFAASKLDVRQDEKDINRDRLEVNGVEVFGAQAQSALLPKQLCRILGSLRFPLLPQATHVAPRTF